MNRETALFLNRMTSDFYRDNARSFSDTRQAPWAGWRTLVSLLHDAWDTRSDSGVDSEAPCASVPGTAIPAHSIIDLACGNLRFERFLASEFPGRPFVFHAYDNCDALALGCANATATHHPVDIVRFLLDERPLSLPTDCDLAACFGFFHHIPTAEARVRALDQLLNAVKPGGITAVSLWRFADDERTRVKAESATARALATLSDTRPDLVGQLGKDDYLLGWQDTRSSFRYCHSFSEDDVDRLAERAIGQARLLARYRADGKNGRSNEYLVFRREDTDE